MIQVYVCDRKVKDSFNTATKDTNIIRFHRVEQMSPKNCVGIISHCQVTSVDCSECYLSTILYVTIKFIVVITYQLKLHTKF